MTTQELVQAVREHAKKNYTKGGWDYVVECFSDAEIVKQIGDAKTAKEAIEKVGWLVELWADQRQDVEGEVF